ncbi:MAG TPA: hypothetical protein VL576_00300 [Candidatus Paceibacterota bacterium]|jgi:hypothetical protein|nr:hypothetical protein [Candidatus Paceibacterota bacterium]
MDNNLSKLKAYKKISLTEEERGLMRAHAARIIMSTPVLVTQSFFKRGVQHGLRIALSSMLFVVFIFGFVATAANNTLPGDPLYGFKRNINERVAAAIVGTSPAAQTPYLANRFIARFNEVKTLADSNSLTPANQEIAAKAITSQAADLSANLTTLSDQSPSSALAVTATLEQALKANKIALENAPAATPAQADGKAAALNTVNSALQTVSNQQVQILSKEIDDISTAVSNVPTTASADTTVSTSDSTSQTPDSGATQTPNVTPAKVTPLAP